MATHSSPLAWKLPWAEEPGRPRSTGSGRVEHDRATSLSLFPSTHRRRPWQPTPVFSPGESQGQGGSLAGCRLWGRTESDTTEATQRQPQQQQPDHLRRTQTRVSVERGWILPTISLLGRPRKKIKPETRRERPAPPGPSQHPFTRVKMGTQPKCPSREDQIKKIHDPGRDRSIGRSRCPRQPQE